MTGARSHEDPGLRATLEALHPSSFAWAMVCCRYDRQEAEEVLHTAYVKILEGRAVHAGRSAFKTWLFGVIRLTARERRRWLARVLRLLSRAVSVEVAEGPHPEQDILLGERERAVRRALRALSPNQCAVIELVMRHGLTLEQAAQTLEMRVGTARTHYARAKAKLFAHLKAGGHGYDE